MSTFNAHEKRTQGRGPIVSVCIPTCNRAGLVVRAIESVLKQSLNDWELIVVDNASSDGTAEAVASYAALDQRIRYVRHDVLVPAEGNLNRCIRHASAALIAILHDDDEYEEDFLASTVPLFDTHPDIGMSYTAVTVTGGEGELLYIYRPFRRDHVWPGSREFLSHVANNHVPAPSVMVRAAAYEDVGMFRADLPMVTDWDMWLRIELAGWSVAYIATPLLRRRVHERSESARFQREKQDKRQMYAFGHLMLRECSHRGIVLPAWTRRRILARWGLLETADIIGALCRKRPRIRSALVHSASAVQHLHSRATVREFLTALVRAALRALEAFARSRFPSRSRKI